MHGTEPKDKSKYDDDLELELRYKADELRADRIWIHENIDDILKVIQTAGNKTDMIFNLKEKFGLSDLQIRKLLSFRLDMLSKSDYSKDVEEQKKFEDRKNRHEGWNENGWTDYCRTQIREEERKIREYNAYITIAENYKDMIDIISEVSDFSEYAKIFSEKYGLDRNQAKLVKLMTVEDLLSADKYREKVEKCEAEIEQYRNSINESKEG
jgi:DNA gyrase/topoisomerase IV subunit A